MRRASSGGGGGEIAQILLRDEKAFSSSRIALFYYNPQGCSGFKSIPSGEKEVFHKSDAVAFHFLRSTFFRRPDISVLLLCEWSARLRRTTDLERRDLEREYVDFAFSRLVEEIC